MSYFDNCIVKFTNIKGGDIPDDVYFKLPGISNSRLKLINPLEEGSPQKYKEGFTNVYNPSLALGSGVHCCFLQPNDYKLSDYDGKPSAKLGYFIDCLYEYRKDGMKLSDAIRKASEKADYYKGKLSPKILSNAIKKGYDYYSKKVKGDFNPQEGKELIVLPSTQLQSCKACLNSLYNNATVKKLLAPNLYEEKKFLNEIALFADLEIQMPNGDHIILPFKGKLDQVIIDPESKLIYLNDLKTTSRPCEMFMGGLYEGEWYNGSWQKLHYMRQFAVYLMLLQMYCETVLHLDDYNYLCNVIVVETTDQNHAKVFPINNSYIQYGAREFKELICRVAFAELYGYDKEINDN